MKPEVMNIITIQETIELPVPETVKVEITIRMHNLTDEKEDFVRGLAASVSKKIEEVVGQ